MRNQAFNPFLPSWEYVPDGEPRVFGDRVYLYGSHDQFNGNDFCLIVVHGIHDLIFLSFFEFE